MAANRFIPVIAAAAATMLLVLSGGRCLAHDWYDRYRDRKPPHALCCGGVDCGPLAAGDVLETKGGYFIKSLNEFVPEAEAQWSEDGRFHRCRKHDGTRRCFFRPSPGV